jgi:hypothetical protein
MTLLLHSCYTVVALLLHVLAQGIFLAIDDDTHEHDWNELARLS